MRAEYGKARRTCEGLSSVKPGGPVRSDYGKARRTCEV